MYMIINLELLNSIDNLQMNKDFENKESLINTYIQNFHSLASVSDNEITPESENYSFLVFLLIAWTRQYHKQIKLLCTDQNNFKIVIDKGVQKNALQSFVKLYEELTLTNLYILDDPTNNKWIFIFYF